MPLPYPPEFRARAIALVREDRQVKQNAADLGIRPVTLHSWLPQDDIDQGRRPGRSIQESAELRAARGRIRPLEQELANLRRAATWLDQEGGVAPKGAPVIDRLVDAGDPVNTCCRILGVSRRGDYRYRKRPTSSTELRRRWLTVP